MKQNLFILPLLTLFCWIGITACGNKSQNTQNAISESASTCAVLEVDSLLAQASQLVDQPIVLEGICTHTCRHGASKMFLMGSNDKQTIRVEAGELGSFDTQCVNNIVRIKGTLKEERIDETYLLQWENAEKEAATTKHNEGGAGCTTEKNARGETANTAIQRIADFRAKIAQRQAQEGKAYLSFYYVIANHYEIK